MPSRKRPRVVAAVGAVIEIFRRDAQCYERVSVVRTGIRDSWHSLACAGGAVVVADLSQEKWRYAKYTWLPLGLCTLPLQTESIDDNDSDDDEYHEQRRKIRPDQLMVVKTSLCSADAESETSQVKNNENELGDLFVHLKLQPKDEMATVMARLSIAQAPPTTRSRISAGIQALRGMLAGLTINFGGALGRNQAPESDG